MKDIWEPKSFIIPGEAPDMEKEAHNEDFEPYQERARNWAQLTHNYRKAFQNDLYEILRAKCKEARQKREKHPIWFLYNINDLEQTFEGRFLKGYWKIMDTPLI